MACTLLSLVGTGCIVPRAQYDARVAEARAWAATAATEATRARTLEARLHALEAQLAALEGALARLSAERVAVAVQARVLREGLTLSEDKRRLLEEHNAQLTARQRQLQALHSELADVWFNSALSRARRRSQPAQGPVPVQGRTRPGSGTP